jgi:uncharacterized protein YkwD
MPNALNVMLRVGVASVLACAGLFAVSTASPVHAAESQTYLNGYESQVVSAINAQRAKYGLRALSYTACPDKYSEALALKLRTSSVLTHQSMTTVMNGCHATRAAENIARARMPAKNLVALWMGSPGHRANILDRYVTQVGVGTQCSTLCTTVADFVRR